MSVITVRILGPVAGGKTRLSNIAISLLADAGFRSLRSDDGRLSRAVRARHDIVFEEIICTGELRCSLLGEAKRPDVAPALKVALKAALNEVQRQNKADETPRVEHPGYLVWNPTGPHRPGVVHKQIDGARNEAKRMANAHAGQNFFVMHPISCYRAGTAKMHLTDEEMQPVRTFDFDDEIPF